MTGGGRSIIVIGGGASGILLGANILKHSDSRVRVTIIEKRGELGRGLAFTAVQPDYILNVPAKNMSAYADSPDDFRNWLRLHHPELPDDPWLFAPRQTYGEYLGSLVDADRVAESGDARLTVVTEKAVSLRELNGGVEVLLANGTVQVGQVAVLAVGHEEQPARGNGLAVRAGSDADTDLDPEASVMILGSGLSMVDAWLTLAARRHRGRVSIVSRHGLLPLEHHPVSPLDIDAADVPFGTNLGYLLRWFKALVEDTEAAGGDWRSVVDGLRPFNQLLWQSWTQATRRAFLEHARPLWNIHRHRLPPKLHALMREAIASDQVELIAGRLLNLDAREEGVRATIRRRGTANDDIMDVARVYDCGGVTLDVTTSSNPVVQSLLHNGSARPDPHRIGLDVTPELNVVGTDGRPSQRVFAVGPLTRGQFFEIEAVPDIRKQCADLVARLVA